MSVYFSVFYVSPGAPMVSNIEEREGGWTTKVDSTTATSSSAATSAKRIWR